MFLVNSVPGSRDAVNVKTVKLNRKYVKINYIVFVIRRAFELHDYD